MTRDCVDLIVHPLRLLHPEQEGEAVPLTIPFVDGAVALP